MKASPLARKPVEPLRLVDVPGLAVAYRAEKPALAAAAHRVASGDPGHRGSGFKGSFEHGQIPAVSQAVYRNWIASGNGGPLRPGPGRPAIPGPTMASVLHVLAAKGVSALIARGDEDSQTRATCRAIPAHNVGRESGRADGISNDAVAGLPQPPATPLGSKSNRKL